MLINGPNLNLLGTREPEIYGHKTLNDIELNLTAIAKEHDAELVCFQSNAEHELVEIIHTARTDTNGIIINPGALTHSSIALRDALSGVGVPFIEVHISNVHAREAFRHKSFLSPKCKGVIAGFGLKSYELGISSFL